MNIFVVDSDPRAAARQLCNRHTVKMPIETAQMLCTALQNHQYRSTKYGPTHVSHPCTKWASANRANFLWLAKHGMELCREYTRRYGREHKCQAVIEHCMSKAQYIPAGKLQPFVVCMPDKFKVKNDPVMSYRNYYNLGKGYMNRGTGPRWKEEPPLWYSNGGSPLF